MQNIAAVAVAFVLAFTGLVAVPGPAVAFDVGQLGQWHHNPATGHAYRQVNDLTWEEAEAYAVGVGGHLVTINDPAEEAWLEATFTDRNLWIGFSDRDVEGTWVWSSGEPVTYTNWSSGEPNNCTVLCGAPPESAGEDAAVMNWLHENWPEPGPQPLGWNDLPENGPLGAIVEVAPHTVTTRAFTVAWSPVNPEEILFLSWNGSPNLTNSSPHLEYPCGGDSEFFGNSWGDEPGYVSPVGWGTSGQWSARGSTRVSIDSSASGCYGTSGIPVATSYQFFPQGVTQNQFLVQRRFSFGSTPFDYTFRPYIPRLHVGNFSTILYPDATGTNLVVVDDTGACGYGCLITDWNASWFALLDPESGSGMIVRHVPSSHRAVLWIDTDYYSLTTSSAVALVPPAGGFTGTVIENERLCFFDGSSWTPSLRLPKGCE